MPDQNRELVKSIFWIICIALTLTIILAAGIWGCDRWNRNKSHNMPNSLLVVPANSSYTVSS